MNNIAKITVTGRKFPAIIRWVSVSAEMSLFRWRKIPLTCMEIYYKRKKIPVTEGKVSVTGTLNSCHRKKFLLQEEIDKKIILLHKWKFLS